jgi:hypothetical protein
MCPRFIGPVGRAALHRIDVKSKRMRRSVSDRSIGIGKRGE